jgi:glycosyltransferase involved in cell wall biosynthesis
MIKYYDIAEDPIITVLLPTYNRKEILHGTIDRLRANLIYDGKVAFIIGNDGESLDGEDYGEDAYIIQGPKKGLGANLNELIRYSYGIYSRYNRPLRSQMMTHLIMPMDDDHWLNASLDLNRHVAAMRKNKYMGWIRLMQCAGHDFTATQEDYYWKVSWHSQGLYITSNRPSLRHPQFHNYFGLYQENKTLGQTEEHFCHSCKDAGRKYISDGVQVPHVYIPMDSATEFGWDHVGESWQKAGF